METERSSLLPLDVEGALWVAAIDRVHIGERVEWVKTILGRISEINEMRALGSVPSLMGCTDCKRQDYICFCGDALGCTC